MKTWEDFEDDVNRMVESFETMFQLWWNERGYAKPALREDLDREMKDKGSFLEKAKATCPHGKSPLTCSICYFNN